MKNPLSPARRKAAHALALVLAAVAALSLLGVIAPPLPVRAAMFALNVVLLALVVRSRRAARVIIRRDR